MDRRQVELQVQLVLVTVRREASRLDDRSAAIMRKRGRQILDELRESLDDDPQLLRLVEEARRELEP